MDRPRRWHLGVPLLALVLTACSADDPTSPPTVSPTSAEGSAETPTSSVPADGTAGWTQTLDSRPTQLAVREDRVFLATAGFRYAPQVFALDADTGQVLAQRTAVGQPYDLLVAPDGRLWIAGEGHIDQPGGGGVNVHDPSSLAVVQHADLPGTALSLALVGDDVWVGSDDAVYVLDAASLELVRTLKITGSASQLIPLPDGSAVLVVEGGALELLDADGVSVTRRAVEADGSIVAAATSESIFVRIPVVTDSVISSYGLRLDGEPTETGIETDSTGGGLLATSRDGVVLVDDRSDQLVCLPGSGGPAVREETDATGVLGELDDGRVLLSLTSGIAAQDVDCGP